MTRFLFSLFVGFFLFSTSPSIALDIHDPRALEADPLTATSKIAPKLEGLGDYDRKVTTNSTESQYFFNQGLRLTYAFNHSEALRSFKEAVRLDPNNAMAYWGWALVLGPNINLPMQGAVVEQAYNAMQKAVELSANVSQQEQDMINALATRYVNDPSPARGHLDKAYSDALKALVAKYPDDLDAATLYAASLMNLSPWNYWTKDGKPRENTEEVIATLSSVIDRNPKHPGALHYHIHIVEAYRPEEGVKSADLLLPLMPGAGHMVHMPSHIYMRVGRYKDGYDANMLATQADESYIASCNAQGLYALGYYPHNVHFLAWAAQVEGRKAEALATARRVAERDPKDQRGVVWGLHDTFLAFPLYTMVRFGMWDEVFNEPKPDENNPYLTAVWHYARGLAYAAQDDALEQALAELRDLDRLKDEINKLNDNIPGVKSTMLVTIASHVLHGEVAASMGSHTTAITHFDKAVRLEDALPYNEPPDWYYSVRHTLGAALLDADRPIEAEVVYWDDLAKHPENANSLFGLAQAMRAQGRDDEATGIQARFEKAYARADHKLTSSRY